MRLMPEAPAVDVAVIGAGVVGLAVARALARAGREVVVLEAAGAIGTHSSSRNSEGVHAGLYYPDGSWKARLCAAGRRAMYAYCAERQVAHRRVGKLVVATSAAEVPALEALHAQATRNGVDDLAWLDAGQVRRLEPEVTAVAALHSPSTGILDSHGVMLALRGDLEEAGGRVIVRAPVLRGAIEDHGIALEVGGAEPVRARCRAVVNSAGLSAPAVARTLDGLPPASIPGQYFAKGHYFLLRGRSPFSRLIYPLPVAGGLGVHVTLDLAGNARFGPDVTWVDAMDYAFDESRAALFYPAIRRYFPGLADGALEPGMTGIRPKLAPAGGPAQDFVLQGADDHGVKGLVNLYGIESPGFTCALVIAERVAALLAG
jgi:L-2-hydroxyglutarate oxidase LhgO